VNIVDMATQSDGSILYVIRGEELHRSNNSAFIFPIPAVVFPTQFVNPPRLVAMAPDNPQVVIVCDSKPLGNQIWLSNDYCSSWTNLGAPKPGDFMTVTDIAVTHELAAGRWYIATIADNRYNKTEKGDVMWRDFNPWTSALPPGNSYDYMAVQASPHIQEDVCICVVGATLDNGVHYQIIKPNQAVVVQTVPFIPAGFTQNFRSNPAGYSILCADIALAPEFSGDQVQNRKAYVCLSTNTYSPKDGVYKIINTSVTKVLPTSSTTGIGFKSLDIKPGLLMAGENNTNTVRHLLTPFTGNTWFGSSPKPSGQKQVVVGVNSVKCFAGTSGNASGLSKSNNNGNSFYVVNW
jgi:hypothetical protein